MNRNKLLNRIIKDGEKLEEQSNYELEIEIAFNVGEDFFTVEVKDVIEGHSSLCEFGINQTSGYFARIRQTFEGNTMTPKAQILDHFYTYKQARELFNNYVVSAFPRFKTKQASKQRRAIYIGSGNYIESIEGDFVQGG